MEWGMSEARCPVQSPASYLAWASWWHRLDTHLDRLAQGDAAPEVAVLDRSELWERLLETISRQASRAMLSHDRTIEPLLRAPKHEFAEAARVLRARSEWLRRVADDEAPRPDSAVTRLTYGLLDAVDEAADARRPVA